MHTAIQGSENNLVFVFDPGLTRTVLEHMMNNIYGQEDHVKQSTLVILSQNLQI